MTRLPSALKKMEGAANRAIELRRENLERLNRGQAPQLPEAQAPAVRQQEPPAAVQPEAAAAPPDTEELLRLRSRLSTSEGMHRADNERYRQELAASRQREEALARRLQQSPRAEPVAAEELRRYVTPEQLAEFGEEHCRMIVGAVRAAAGELSRGAVQEEMAALRAELEQQRAVVRRSQEAAFWAAVNAALPRWRETNADQGFLRWLGERDALAGCTRQEVLNQARAALDAERVVAIFNTWGQAQGKPGTGRDASRRVMPNGRAPAALPADAPEQAVSRGWIAEQNRLYAQGYYRRRQQEWQGIQQTIDRAAREGRIR